jgi:hypothetical protein
LAEKLPKLRMKPEANLARHWKYLNHDKNGTPLNKSLDKDFYAWKQEFDKKGAQFAENILLISD